MRSKLCAFCFHEHEIADRELADFGRRGDKRAAEIFRTKFNPTFADLNVRLGAFVRFDVEREMIRSNVIADEAALIVWRAQQNIGGSQVAHRSLGIDVELAERIDFVA